MRATGVSQSRRNEPHSSPVAQHMNSCVLVIHAESVSPKTLQITNALNRSGSLCSDVVWDLEQDRFWDQKWSWSCMPWGLAGLVLCCETRSCHTRRRNDLEGHNNFFKQGRLSPL